MNNYKTLLKQFRELKGAGNIFLICEKLASVTMISPFDFFFCIVLHQEKLKKLFVKDFPLENNYDTLINRLQNFEEIKNNPNINLEIIVNLIFLNLIIFSRKFKIV